MQQEAEGNVEQQAPELPFDESKVEQLMYELRSEQNLVMGILGGAVGAVLGAAIWAVITVVTGYQIGIVAIGVGFLVGVSVRALGKGIDKIYGIIGGGLALLGCLAGNLLCVCIIVAQHEGVPFLRLLGRLDIATVIELMKITFGPMDLVFYGIALYEGYRFSFRQITSEDLARALKAQG